MTSKEYRIEKKKIRSNEKIRMKELEVEEKKIKTTLNQENMTKTLDLAYKQSHKLRHQEIIRIKSLSGKNVEIKFRKQADWKPNKTEYEKLQDLKKSIKEDSSFTKEQKDAILEKIAKKQEKIVRKLTK